MLLHCPVGFADRTEAEVVGPTNHHAIEAVYHRCLIQQGFVPSGFTTDRLTNAGHPLLRRNSAPIGPPRLWRIATSKRLSRPMGFHHRPLAEASVKLSPHSAPVR